MGDRLPGRQRRQRDRQLRPGRLRRRSHQLHRGRRELRRLRLLPQRRRGRAVGAKERCNGEDPIEVPAYVSPIAVAFNLDGVDSLNMSADTIAQIFDGKITKWNDPAIAEENPDATSRDRPSRRCTAPTTRAPRRTSPTTSARPATRGPTRPRTPSRSRAARPLRAPPASSPRSAGDGTIGYADESQVGDLGVVSVKVGEEYVAPSAEGAAKVGRGLAGRRVAPRRHGDRHRPTTEAGAYPVVLLSYVIACQTYEDQNEADLVKGYLSYIVSDEGQQAPPRRPAPRRWTPRCRRKPPRSWTRLRPSRHDRP